MKCHYRSAYVESVHFHVVLVMHGIKLLRFPEVKGLTSIHLRPIKM